MTMLIYDTVATPIGTVVLVVDGERLCSLDYADYEQRMMTLLQKRYGAVQLSKMNDPCGFSSRVQRYFAGDFGCLDEIPVSVGGTPFQQQVWERLRAIPVGKTVTYGEMAAQLGKPKAYRAVGASNALNPIALVLPCHRVVGSNAALTGYAGGLERKQWLLRHEGVKL